MDNSTLIPLLVTALLTLLVGVLLLMLEYRSPWFANKDQTAKETGKDQLTRTNRSRNWLIEKFPWIKSPVVTILITRPLIYATLVLAYTLIVSILFLILPVRGVNREVITLVLFYVVLALFAYVVVVYYLHQRESNIYEAVDTLYRVPEIKSLLDNYTSLLFSDVSSRWPSFLDAVEKVNRDVAEEIRSGVPIRVEKDTLWIGCPVNSIAAVEHPRWAFREIKNTTDKMLASFFGHPSRVQFESIKEQEIVKIKAALYGIAGGPELGRPTLSQLPHSHEPKKQ